VPIWDVVKPLPRYLVGMPAAPSVGARGAVAISLLRAALVGGREPLWDTHQAPLHGLKTSGAFSMNARCWSGVSFTMPQFASGAPSDAKIFPVTRKSG